MPMRWLVIASLLAVLTACSEASDASGSNQDIAADMSEETTSSPDISDASDESETLIGSDAESSDAIEEISKPGPEPCEGDACDEPPLCSEDAPCELKLTGYVYGGGFATLNGDGVVLQGASGTPRFIGMTTDGTWVLRAGLPPRGETK